jgi:NADPH:quinone reductase-like Zn-dependent oxidoreductase
MPRFPEEAAAYAEYVAAPADELARIPDGLSDVEAGALPLAGLTAWQALVGVADVQPGQRVLILAAAGGVGHLAVQIAKARGAYVIGTARLVKEAFLHELGVDEAIDYTSVAVESVVSDVDLVLDLVGGDASAPTIACLRDGGLYIAVPSASALDRLNELAGDRVRVTGILVHPDRPGLEALAALTEAGQLKVTVEHTFPLEQAAKAHEWGETGRTQGKLVLTVES